MSDITLSPLPYNGGTLSLTNANSHICHLSGNKFFSLFGQTNPNMMFAATINVSDLHAVSPTCSIGKQRFLSTTALTRTRVWKLNSTTVLALVNTDLVVYKVQPDDDVIQKAATIVNFHPTYLWGTETAATFGLGNYIVGQYIKDNVIWFIQRASSTGPITFFKIVYDPVGDTLTKTAILTLTANTTATHFWRFSFQQVPGTTNWAVALLGLNTTVSLSTLTAYYIYDENGNQLTAVTSGIPATGKVIVPLAQSKILSLSDPRTYRAFDGAAWAATDAAFAPVSIAGTLVVQAEALTPDYFMVISTTSGVETGYASYNLRIARSIDATLGQSSPNTSLTNGLAIPITNPYFDQKILNSVDSTLETFVFFGRASTTAFRIKVVYQAA